ncbi:hypothetical protein CMO85_02700 [Candidatus Woesearchaeota archaeon]|nr:hypothetical protein [Candidatus Woesearchaeota archaeon]
MVLSLDIPSLDGHLAALEMREHGGESRIVFIAPARMADVARNATFSAGAVAWLQKPVSNESLEAVWSTILGAIPEAPGLEDLDELYPDRIQIEADDGPLLPLPGILPLPTPDALPPLDALPELSVVVPPVEPRKKRRLGRWLVLLLLVAAGIGAAYTQGHLPL